MRHVVLSGAIATGPRRMVHPTAAAFLVAPPGRALGVAPSRLCTALCAVNLATVAVAADQHLSLAAHAQKQSGSRRRRGQQRTWTRSAMTGILPRHACSARCGARRRSETWPLRSAPCRPRQSDRFLPRVEQAAQGRNPPRPQACGFVDKCAAEAARKEVQLAVKLRERWGRAPRDRLSGAGPKPLQAAAVKSRGGERWSKSSRNTLSR